MASSISRFLFLPALTLWLAAAPAAATVNRIVLRVNDRIATLHDYERRKAEKVVALQRSNLPQSEVQERLARVGELTMKELYEELLVLARADQLDFRITPEVLENAVQRTKESFGIESEEDFQQALVSSGMEREDFLEQVRTNLLIQQVMGREVQPRIVVKEEDLRRYYQAHPEEFRLPVRLRLREVVVLDADASPGEVEELARDLRQALLEGEEGEERIAGLAEEGRTTPWIDLGWVGPGDLDRELEAAVFDLAEGEISPPVRARGGLHLIRVMERREAELQEFAEVRDQIEARERDRLFRKEVPEYMAELERKSYIVLKPPPEAAGFRGAGARQPAGPEAAPLAEPGSVPLSAGELELEPDDAGSEPEPMDAPAGTEPEPAASEPEPDNAGSEPEPVDTPTEAELEPVASEPEPDDAAPESEPAVEPPLSD